jgi:hypothetical protein
MARQDAVTFFLVPRCVFKISIGPRNTNKIANNKEHKQSPRMQLHNIAFPASFAIPWFLQFFQKLQPAAIEFGMPVPSQDVLCNIASVSPHRRWMIIYAANHTRSGVDLFSLVIHSIIAAACLSASPGRGSQATSSQEH